MNWWQDTCLLVRWVIWSHSKFFSHFFESSFAKEKKDKNNKDDKCNKISLNHRGTRDTPFWEPVHKGPQGSQWESSLEILSWRSRDGNRVANVLYYPRRPLILHEIVLLCRRQWFGTRDGCWTEQSRERHFLKKFWNQKLSTLINAGAMRTCSMDT